MQLTINPVLQPALPSSALSPALKEEVETRLPSLASAPSQEERAASKIEVENQTVNKKRVTFPKDEVKKTAIDSDTGMDQSNSNTGRLKKKHSTNEATPSLLLGKKYKDSAKTIPKRSTLLGKTTKVIEEEREYAPEEEELYWSDDEKDVRDEPEETK